MPIADSAIDMAVIENTRGELAPVALIDPDSLRICTVLGQDPLIPPQLLQSEIPVVSPRIINGSLQDEDKS